MSHFQSRTSSRSRWSSIATTGLSMFITLAMIASFLGFAPINQIRNPLCRVTHIQFFCRGIIDVQPIQVDHDVLKVGLSEGDFAFDAEDANANSRYKIQATKDLQAGNPSEAIKDWEQAINATTDDAESMIYIENQTVADSKKPYVTIAVATTLSKTSNDQQKSLFVARDDLRGAYWAQRDFNRQHADLKLRLVLANIGIQSQNDLQKAEPPVLQQIIRLSQTDSTFIGVVGFPFSNSARMAIPLLAEQHIPLISPSASGKDLSTMSPYFYRVVPPDTVQGQYVAQFASQVLGAHRIVVFNDNTDSYSGSLGDSVATSISQMGADYQVTVKNFSLGNANDIRTAVRDVLSQDSSIDVFFLAGYSDDLNNLKQELAQNHSSIPVIGGDASYEFGGYTNGSYQNFYFSAFTYPDAWDILCPSGESCADLRPPISDNIDYGKTFDPKAQHTGEYGFARTGPHVLLAYDATSALIQAAHNLAMQSTAEDISQEAVRIALQGVAFQGSSGQVSFHGSDPVNKAVFLLCVDSHHHTQLVRAYGQFAPGTKNFQPAPEYIKYRMCA